MSHQTPSFVARERGGFESTKCAEDTPPLARPEGGLGCTGLVIDNPKKKRTFGLRKSIKYAIREVMLDLYFTDHGLYGSKILNIAWPEEA
ncbi:hypothetical protein SAMN05421665_2375 [Yoonia rosea]|uniref:Uncharacterized protein n=1 Tax=Yoonia rosea TaxID=287098 RepID=A0A1R3XCB9_9RHOB|nr:hypothetical protein [Yoonia rosea]SIT87374.1 hypothetical protein SAMN05421665_2375 [Yoonia rosea]